jgi:glutamyl-tRNA synthetase
LSIKPARTRIAPSPTGHMHLGTRVRRLYDYLLAKKTGGQFILRIEDTDLKRTVPGAEQEIMDGLRWLGLNMMKARILAENTVHIARLNAVKFIKHHAKILVERDMPIPVFALLTISKKFVKNK